MFPSKDAEFFKVLALMASYGKCLGFWSFTESKVFIFQQEAFLPYSFLYSWALAPSKACVRAMEPLAMVWQTLHANAQWYSFEALAAAAAVAAFWTKSIATVFESLEMIK